MDSYLGVPFGRMVVLRDMMEAHPGKPSKCACRGSCIIVKHGPSGGKEEICAVALQHFRKLFAARIIDPPGNSKTRWIRGMAPEDWPFRQIFALAVGQYQFRQRLARTLEQMRTKETIPDVRAS